MKFQEVGERVAMCTPIESALRFYRTTGARDAEAPPKQVVDARSVAKQESLNQMITDLEIFAAKLGPCDVLVLPPGWIIVEKPCINLPCFGSPVVWMPQKFASTWLKLMEFSLVELLFMLISLFWLIGFSC